MVIEGRDKNDDKTLGEAPDKPAVKVGADTVPESGGDDKTAVDVAVAVAADMALTGGAPGQ